MTAALKLENCYVIPYEVTVQMGHMAYHLKVPDSMNLNNTFYAGLFKLYI